jgi:hypothetical protein
MGPVSVGLVDEMELALSAPYTLVVIPGPSVADGNVTDCGFI